MVPQDRVRHEGRKTRSGMKSLFDEAAS
jgi:hypothetical protein